MGGRRPRLEPTRARARRRAREPVALRAFAPKFVVALALVAPRAIGQEPLPSTAEIVATVGRSGEGDRDATRQLSSWLRRATTDPGVDPASLGKDVLHAIQLAAVEVVRAPAAERGDPRPAVEILESVRGFLHAGSEPESEACVAWYLGHAWIARGEPAKACAEWSRGSELPCPGFRPWLLVDLAAQQRAAGEWNDAQVNVEKAERSLRDDYEPHRRARAAVLGERGAQELELGAANRAAAAFREEAALAATLDDPTARLSAALHGVHYALGVQDWSGAIDRSRAALADAAMIACAPGCGPRFEALASLAEAELAEGDLARLRDVEGRLGRAAAELAPGDPTALYADVALARLEIGRGALDDAAARIGRALERARSDRHAAPRAELAALAARAARVRAATDPTKTTELAARLASLRATYDEFLDEWGRVPVRAGGVGFLEFGDRQRVVGELVELEIAAGGDAGAEAALGAVLRAQAQGSLARAERLAPGTVAEVREAFAPPGHGVVVFLPAPEESHVFALDRERLVHARIGRGHEIEALARELGDAAERAPDSGGARAGASDAARRLGERLFPEPIRARLASWRSVTIVGGELLYAPPLACVPAVGGRPLGITHALTELPSLPVGLWLVRRAKAPLAAASSELVVVGAPALSPAAVKRWPMLRPFELGAEARARLAGAYPADRVREHLGGRATRDAATARTLRDARVLQVVAHGVYDPSRDRPAGIVMAGEGDDDGGLWSDAVEAGSTPALVALAACGSDRAPSRRGDDGIQHLGAAFLRAGARVVIAARADVDLAATLELTARFHEGLRARGESPAEAMRRAREEVSALPRYADPYFWALPQVMGLGAVPLFEARAARPSRAFVVLLASGVAIVTAILAARRSRR